MKIRVVIDVEVEASKQYPNPTPKEVAKVIVLTLEQSQLDWGSPPITKWKMVSANYVEGL